MTQHGHGDADQPSPGDRHEHEHGPGPGSLRSRLGHLLRPHSHDAAASVDAELEGSTQGIRAVKISLVVLGVTAALQAVLVAVTGSVALLADTIHNFSDALTAVPLWVALGVLAGYPLADPIVGLLITSAILFVLRGAAVEIYRRLMDAVDPDLVDRAHASLAATLGVVGVDEVRLRWVGHRVRAEASIHVDPVATLVEAHAISVDAHHRSCTTWPSSRTPRSTSAQPVPSAPVSMTPCHITGEAPRTTGPVSGCRRRGPPARERVPGRGPPARPGSRGLRGLPAATLADNSSPLAQEIRTTMASASTPRPDQHR